MVDLPLNILSKVQMLIPLRHILIESKKSSKTNGLVSASTVKVESPLLKSMLYSLKAKS